MNDRKFKNNYFLEMKDLFRYSIIYSLLILLLSPLASEAMEKVRLQLKWKHQFQFAGYYAAQAQGYYEAAGLEVEIIPSQLDENAVQQVLKGKAEFGVGTTELLLLREQGQPVVVLATIFQHSPLALMTLKQDGIQSIHDLAGHKVMIEPEAAELYAYLGKEGVSHEKFTLLPHTLQTEDLLSGKVDGMSIYVTDEPFELKAGGHDYLLYSPRSVGIDFYGDNLFTTEQLLQQKPEMVRAFREASLKGWVYAMANPEEMVQLIYNQYSQQHSLEHLRFEANQMATLLQAELVEIGHMNPGRWQHIAETYADLGLMKPKFNLKEFLYDPNPPPPDLKWLIVLTGLACLAVICVFSVAFFIYRANMRLRREGQERKLIEEELRTSEEKFRSTINDLLVGVIVHDPDSNILLSNLQASKILGISQEQMNGKQAIDPDWHFVYEDLSIVNIEDYPVNRVISTKKGIVNQIMGVKKPKIEEITWALISAIPIFTDTNVLNRIVINFMDITERKQTEERNKLQQYYLEKGQELGEIGSWDLDLILNRLRCTDENCRIFGVPPGSVVNYEIFLEKIHPDDQEYVDRKWKAALAGKPYDIEHRIVVDGITKWVREKAEIKFDSEGVAINAIGFTQDITERKQMALENERLMLAINQAEEIVTIIDVDGIIQYVNPAFERITGYSCQEAIGKTPRMFKNRTQDEDFYKEIWQTLMAGDNWSGHLVNRKKDGTLYTEDATISPVKDHAGKIVNYVAVKHDVTEELKLESQLRQSQKMESIGQLVGGVAHDFNNILQVIMGFVNIAQMQLESGHSAVESLTEIATASDRAKDLVQQLLTFSRQQVIDPKDLDLNAEIESSQQMLGRVIGEHIKLNFVTEKNLPPVFVDKGQIHQVLMNVCINARDAMPDGGMLTIKTKAIKIAQEDLKSFELSHSGSYILLSIDDTGCGMDKAICDRIFDPFFTTKGLGKGTGLGLSTVYGIVKQNGGHIAVASEKGTGTVFKIYLPVSKPYSIAQTTEIPRSIVTTESVTPAESGAETILVAEDDEIILILSTHFLSSAGYKVLTAKDGAEAVQIFEEHADEIDCVMMDVVMPHMGGKEAMELILKKCPSMPYLFCSGYTQDDGQNDFTQEQQQHLLGKPYQFEELLHKIREVMDEK